VGARSEVTSAAGGPERLYRGLLRLYPADYRAHYTDQMVQLFTDQKRTVGAIRAWLRAPLDVITTAVGEHLRRNRTVAHSMTIAPSPAGRLLGLLGVVGGAFLLLGYVNLDQWTPDLFNLRLLLFNLGAIAVGVAAYPRHAAVSRPLALAGTIPVVVANAAYLLFILKLVAQPGEFGPGDYQPVNLFLLTAAAMWLADAWFGLVTLRVGVLSRWSALALLVGSIAAFAGMDNFGLAPEGSLASKVILVGLALHGFAWVLIGLELAFRRRPVPPAAPA
jgi:hypothetical protein